MPRHALSVLLTPRAVAVIGGSDRPGTVGAVVVANLIKGGFQGAIHVVNPRPLTIPGVQSWTDLDQLPTGLDLAVVVSPAATAPSVIAGLGRRGVKVAMVISAGVSEENGLRPAMLAAAKPSGLRIVGPNGLGLLAPHAKLNASFTRGDALPGRLAFISQSGALITAMLDWAKTRRIGFSGVVSAGDMADADLGDLIDLFAADPHTDAILMYVEGVTEAAKFMSAARAAARNKPVIAIKAGRSADAGRAARSHTGALAGAYDVHACAFERAGIVMVDTLEDLFDAAEMLGAVRAGTGDRLAIVTNGGGAGVLTVDALDGTGARLAALSSDTLAKLEAAMPAGWSHANPIDLLGDAHADRYRVAIDAVLADPGVDAVLVMNCPTAVSTPQHIAQAVVEAAAQARTHGESKPVLACWLGDANASAVREVFATAGIALFDSPDAAARGFGYRLTAGRARATLTTAPTNHAAIAGDRAAVETIFTFVRDQGRTLLNEVEAKAVLAAYGVPVVATRFAASIQAVEDACQDLAPPYAIKIVSPDIAHKSDVGGVALDLPNVRAAAAAARAMREAVARHAPQARLTGFAVETIVPSGGHEVIIGLTTDPLFGPVLMVGAGGVAVEVLNDKALGLPPLDEAQARGMIARTRVSRLLAGYRNVPPADVGGLARVIMALSALVVNFPDVVELDINPLRVDEAGVIALDARLVISALAAPPSRRVIATAPTAWTTDLTTRSGLSFHVRPVRADDEPALAAFFTQLTPEDLRMRFLTGLHVVDHDRLSLMTQIDYARTMTFLALEPGTETILAVAMLAKSADPTRAEIAVSVRSDLKGKGLGWTLMDHTLAYARAEGVETIESLESAENGAALRLEAEMGFSVRACPEDMSLRRVERRLTDPLPQT
ncbi:bifunctional acetate--CoA ligase family protein/GNAT family N-acetyltransferase [soil metagenome]